MKQMRACCWLMIMWLASAGAQTATPDLSFEIHNPVQRFSKIKCLVLMSGDKELMSKVAPLMRFDLEFSDQLDIELSKYDGQITPSLLTKLFNQGTSLCLCLKLVPKASDTSQFHMEVRETSAGTILFDKTATVHRVSLIYDVHSMCDELMPALTGKKCPLLSSLAYCKAVSPQHKVVCVADYSCKLEKIVAQARTINTVPRWHSQAPVLFYSQFTRSNSRLMSCDMKTKQHRVICSFDGLNMQPSFSPDGTKAVLCLSGDKNSEIYFYDQIQSKANKKRTFQPLTHNGGNNASPCFLPNGNVAFCSDFESRYPQLYLLNGISHKVTRLTNGRGYCAAPSYCVRTNTIVYTRYIDGIFQLCLLNLGVQPYRERQLTRSPGDKTEPTWSECGEYVAFAYNFIDPSTKKRANQIAVLNLLSGKIRVLTSGKEPKSFPVWTSRSLYSV
jgi:tol-pal system beta propeller repeat protein TolB